MIIVVAFQLTHEAVREIVLCLRGYTLVRVRTFNFRLMILTQVEDCMAESELSSRINHGGTVNGSCKTLAMSRDQNDDVIRDTASCANSTLAEEVGPIAAENATRDMLSTVTQTVQSSSKQFCANLLHKTKENDFRTFHDKQTFGCFTKDIDNGNKITNFSPWNFDEIDFPDISQSVHVYRFKIRPQFCPEDIKCPKGLQSLRINRNLDNNDELQFSQGSIGVKQRLKCKNWTELKSKLDTLSFEDSLLTSPVGYLWENDDVTPLIKPYEAVNTGWGACNAAILHASRGTRCIVWVHGVQVTQCRI